MDPAPVPDDDPTMPKPGDPLSLRCHICSHPRRRHHGALICPRCDLNHDQE